MIPDGYVARVDGAEYEASPDGALIRLYTDEPTEGFDEVAPHRYRRLIPATSVEWLGYLRTTATLKGQPVTVLAERPGQVLVEYIGGNARNALALGLPRTDIGVYRGWMPTKDLQDVRRDHLGE